MECINVKDPKSWLQFQAAYWLITQPKSKIGWFNFVDSFLSSNSLFDPYLARCHHSSWIVRENNIILGRITAIYSSNGIGRFGFLNCFDVISALTSKAEGWLRCKGATEVLGPFNPTMYSSCGLLKYSDQPISYGYPNTPSYLITCLEKCGYVAVKSLYTFSQSKELYEQLNSFGRLNSFIKSYMGNDMKLVTSSWSNFSRDCKWLNTLINNCWSSNWGFETISPHESFQLNFKINFTLPKGSLCFVLKDGEPIAISLSLPDANEIANQLPAYLGVFNIPRLLFRLKCGKASHYRMALLGVLPEYQSTPQGLAAAFTLIQHFISVEIKNGGKSADMGWILDDNYSMLRFLKIYGVTKTMEHSIMGKDLCRPDLNE